MITPQEFNDAPKQFVEASLFGFGDEVMVFALKTGSKIMEFAFSPKHSKQFFFNMKKTIESYESLHGEIKLIEEGRIISPIQMDNLGGTEK